MKKFKSNMILYLLFPIITISIIVIYSMFFYSPRYGYVNVINLLFDIALLSWYFYSFCFRIIIEGGRMNFHTLFKKYSILLSELDSVRISSFLTKIKHNNGSFYILTTGKTRTSLEDFLRNEVQ